MNSSFLSTPSSGTILFSCTLLLKILYFYYFTNRNTIACFLLLHKLRRNLAHILLIQRRAAEVGFDIGHGQDTPIAVVRLVCDIVFRDSGQYVQRNAEGLDAFDISHLLVCKLNRLAPQSAKLQGIGNGGIKGQCPFRADHRPSKNRRHCEKDTHGQGW